ncbi:MAG: co-chaperone GroES [Deltaproteobacteria bacterium]|nr:MAG: co-chaperone GroES [Deltaproteobacteria bacterium]
MDIQPLNAHVLIRNVEADTRTASGLYLPDNAQEKPTQGIVVAMASDVGEDLKLGDRVIYKKYAGEEITFDGEKLRLVPYADLLARLPQGDAIPD